MELSAEILHSTVASVKPFPGERRQHQRLPFRFRVKIIPYENGTCRDPVSVWTRDISPGGIGIIHRTPIREGHKFIIRLPRQDGSAILLLCTVRNCTQLAKDVYGIGATFAEVAELPSRCDGRQRDEVIPIPFMTNAIPVGSDLTEEIRRLSEAILA